MGRKFDSFPAEALNAAAAEIGKANGIPNWFYANADSLEAEKEALFAAGWAGIGFEKDVAENGCVFPVSFLGEPLFIARDNAGEIRVFQNVCRHRGAILVEEARKTTGLVRCPYHAWCYSLRGELKQTPHAGGPDIHQHEAIDKSRLGLIEIRSHVFLGVVFINLSGETAPFEDHFAAMLERWQEFDRPVHHGGPDSQFQLSLKTNWKLAIENYCESYHLPFVHPGLNSYSRLEDHEDILGEGPWAGQLTRVYDAQLDPNGRCFPPFSGLSERWQNNAEYLALYPNVLLGVHKDHSFAIVVEPASNERTIEHVAIFYASPETQNQEWAAMRERNAQLWKEVFLEDVGVVESMQKGRNASRFDGGHFSPVMDRATHHFHRWVATQFLCSRFAER